jgi:hypothetical protein
LKNGELALVATLNNDKKVLLEIEHSIGKCHFRYLTKYEMDSNQLNTKGLYIWHETDIHATVEGGERIVFATIEATPVVLHRQQDVSVNPLYIK